MLNPKCRASSLSLYLSWPVWVLPGRKPRKHLVMWLIFFLPWAPVCFPGSVFNYSYLHHTVSANINFINTFLISEQTNAKLTRQIHTQTPCRNSRRNPEWVWIKTRIHFRKKILIPLGPLWKNNFLCRDQATTQCKHALIIETTRYMDLIF